MRANELTIIKLSVFFEPGRVYLDGIMARAEAALEINAISSLPEIVEVTESKIKPFWTISIKTKPEDWSFWFGFYLGRDWCVNNRLLTVGVE